MNSLRKQLICLGTLAIVWTGMCPAVASAQTSGIGADGLTRVLWRGTDGRIALQTLDATLDVVVKTATYGPVSGWIPLGITVAPNNNTYLLWRHTGGAMSLWRFDANLNRDFMTQSYGPATGYVAQTLSSGGPNSEVRVVWRHTTGQMAIWRFSADLFYIHGTGHGPVDGYDPGTF